MARSRRAEATALPAWIKPQLTKLVDAPPDGPEWLHEIKFDGYRDARPAGLGRGAAANSSAEFIAYGKFAFAARSDVERWRARIRADPCTKAHRRRGGFWRQTA